MTPGQWMTLQMNSSKSVKLIRRYITTELHPQKRL
jgi:hypothetical protein